MSTLCLAARVQIWEPVGVLSFNVILQIITSLLDGNLADLTCEVLGLVVPFDVLLDSLFPFLYRSVFQCLGFPTANSAIKALRVILLGREISCECAIEVVRWPLSNCIIGWLAAIGLHCKAALMRRADDRRVLRGKVRDVWRV